MGTYDREEIAERSKKMAKIVSLAMITLGVLSILLPVIVGIAISILLGIVMVIAGLAYEVLAISTHGIGAFWWRVLVGAGFIVAGSYLLLNPETSFVTLTVVLALVFFFEGIVEIASFLTVRTHPNSGWLIGNSAISLLFAALIWHHWPASSAWVIGVLVGVNLITSGLTPLKFSPLATSVDL